MSALVGMKQYGTAVYPVHAAATSGLLKRAEPILTPEQLVSRFLKGIPIGNLPNGDKYTVADLKDRIVLATNQAELLIGRPIFPEVFKEKAAYDYNLYKQFIHIKTEQGPITTLEYLAIVSADGNNIFQIPVTWIEASNFSKNLINVIPLLAAYGVNTVQGAVGNAGIAFLTIMGNLGWVPAYWEIGYTAGLSNTEGQVPLIVNELIGTIAAMDILSPIAALFIHTSQSLSQDGISQSSSGPGPAIYARRMEDLEKKRNQLVAKIRGVFSSKFFISNI